MKRHAWWRGMSWGPGLLLVALMQGCSSGSTGVDTRRFACTDDLSCASGFVCRAGECQRELVPPGGGNPGAPDAGGGEDAGAPDAGAPDAGAPDASLPDGGEGSQGPQLAFVGTAQGAEAGTCVAEVLETRNAAGGPVAVDSATTVQLSVQPTNTVGFYQDSNCKTAITSVGIAAGSSRATFYFRGTVAQTVRLSASATGYTPALRDEVIRAAAAARITFASTPQTVASGACSALLVLEGRDAYGNAATFTSAQSVTLSGTNLTFYPDTTCTSAQSTFPFAAGAQRLTFAFKGRGNGSVTLAALLSGQFTPVLQQQTLLPTTRAGSCVLPSGSNSVTCTISPAHIDTSRTLLFFQASPSGNSPDSGSVRCRLSARDAVTCGRNANDRDIYITWYTAELPGAKVQHLETQCGGSATTSFTAFTPVSTANTFLLTSSEVSGKAFGDDDLATVTLSASNKVDFQFSTTCASGWKSWFQLVEAPAMQVTRGTTNAMTGTSLTVSGLSKVNLATTALLYTYRVSNTGSAILCDRMLRGELTADNTITFTRGAGNTYRCDTAVIDSISWERIDFGSLAQVQRLVAQQNSGTSYSTESLSPAVDTSRTVLFASGQGVSGQAGGESSYPNGTPLGAALGWFEFNEPPRFSVERELTPGNVRWSVNAVQFDP